MFCCVCVCVCVCVCETQTQTQIKLILVLGKHKLRIISQHFLPCHYLFNKNVVAAYLMQCYISLTVLSLKWAQFWIGLTDGYLMNISVLFSILKLGLKAEGPSFPMMSQNVKKKPLSGCFSIRRGDRLRSNQSPSSFTRNTHSGSGGQVPLHQRSPNSGSWGARHQGQHMWWQIHLNQMCWSRKCGNGAQGP